MTQDEIRDAIRARIKEKKYLYGSGAVMNNINEAIKNYPELTPRERDFAFRSSIEHRSVYQWAAFYNVSYYAIYYMLHNPRVKQLIEEIQFNLRKYTVGMQVLLLREAMMQYLKIFRTPEFGDNIESKRKAAKEIMSNFGLMKESGEEGNTQLLNVNIFNDKSGGEDMRDVGAEGANDVTISVTELEEEMRELKQLEDMRSKIAEHDKKTKGTSKDHGGGFEGVDAPEIKLY